MNGYFKLEQNEKGVSIRLIPPTEGGEKIRVTELREYLDRLGVTYDPMAINSALYQLSEEDVVLFLSPIKIPAVDEKCNIIVAEDKLSAVLRFYPGDTDGKLLTAAYVKELLSDMKIKYGIDEEAITKVLDEKIYCTDVIIAKGKLPTAGRDAKINYYFDTNNKARPELKEDGSVDFFKLNTLHMCTKGQESGGPS